MVVVVAFVILMMHVVFDGGYSDNGGRYDNDGSHDDSGNYNFDGNSEKFENA